MSKELVESIKTCDASGRIFIVQKLQNFQQWTGLNSSQVVKGAVEYILNDGRHVNLKRDGTFQIVSTDEILSRLD